MPLNEIEEIVSVMMKRRDSMSLKAAKAIRALQSQVEIAYSRGWHECLDATQRKLAEEMKV